MIRQSLELKLGQRLTMTPQLQQAIRLLQLSTIELQQEIQQALETNVMLEVGETLEHDLEPELQIATAEAEAERVSAEADEAHIDSEHLPDEPELQDPWAQGDEGSYSGKGDGDGWDFNQTPDNASAGLHQHLLWQLDLNTFSDTDRIIALTIIDGIDDDGYLRESIESLQSTLASSFEEITTEEIETVLHRIQRFDPVGVGGRDLQETLLIQMDIMTDKRGVYPVARLLVQEHLQVLAGRDYNSLMRKLKISEDELRDAITLIQSLDPRPGARFTPNKTEYIVPDVYVRRTKQGWRVELNPAVAPNLQVNQVYETMIRTNDTGQQVETLKQQLQEARWFIKSLQSRNDTLLKVAACIVERQQGFFDHGEVAMQPLVLREIAESVHMHESTISRVTTQKYMLTPRGILEFKYFFSSSVGTIGGGECSATAIQAMIRKLIATENPRKPLSDSGLVDLLTKAGINVARRTIAKYREAMSIPPSNERKRLT